jgi:hypothetical protein
MENQSSSRKRFSLSERNSLLESYRQSGLTQRQFADQAGISLSSLQRWLGLNGREKPSAPAVQLLEVKAVPPAPGLAAGYSVELPGGAVLRVPRGFVAGEVAQLARLFQSL